MNTIPTLEPKANVRQLYRTRTTRTYTALLAHKSVECGSALSVMRKDIGYPLGSRILHTLLSQLLSQRPQPKCPASASQTSQPPAHRVAARLNDPARRSRPSAIMSSLHQRSREIRGRFFVSIGCFQCSLTLQSTTQSKRIHVTASGATRI